MEMDRGTLARIDRRLTSGLGHGEAYRMLRLPVSDATWSTWRRYCEAIGVPMGRAAALLVQNELRSVVHEADGGLVVLAELERKVTERQLALDARERDLEEWQQKLKAMTRVALVARQPSTQVSKVGRNDPCPCGSGLKYKRCHGM